MINYNYRKLNALEYVPFVENAMSTYDIPVMCVLFLVGKNQFYRPVLSYVPVAVLSAHLGLPYVQSTYQAVPAKWKFPPPAVLHNAVSP